MDAEIEALYADWQRTQRRHRVLEALFIGLLLVGSALAGLSVANWVIDQWVAPGTAVLSVPWWSGPLCVLLSIAARRADRHLLYDYRDRLRAWTRAHPEYLRAPELDRLIDNSRTL